MEEPIAIKNPAAIPMLFHLHLSQHLSSDNGELIVFRLIERKSRVVKIPNSVSTFSARVLTIPAHKTSQPAYSQAVKSTKINL